MAACLAIAGGGIYEFPFLMNVLGGLGAAVVLSATVLFPALALLWNNRDLRLVGMGFTAFYIPPVLLAAVLSIFVGGSDDMLRRTRAFIEGALLTSLLHAVLALCLLIAALQHRRAMKRPTHRLGK